MLGSQVNYRQARGILSMLPEEFWACFQKNQLDAWRDCIYGGCHLC